MGSKQSTLTTLEIKDQPQKQEVPPSSESGRKQSTSDSVLEETLMISIKAEDPNVFSGSDSDDSDDYSIDDDSEEDEEWNERLRILQDARSLRKLAEFFMSPEMPVIVDATAKARCYFSRVSAPEVTSLVAEQERSMILADAQALKEQAVTFLHPENPVVASDAFATGRNYFNRPSAPTNEAEDERAAILADASALKKFAVDYLQLEKPIVTSDPFATGRNYFSRFSAGATESDLDNEREQILAEVQGLKKLAVDYLHPELPVITSDPCATGRNYFTRPSAEEYKDEDYMDDSDEILEDIAALKRLAMDYLQPERAVQVDPRVFCRNYFTRPSALQQENIEEAEERARVLADAQALKKLAVDYLHPEKPVATSDPCATGRNYFTRPSAEGYDVEEEAFERAEILNDLAELKRLAVDFLHPELPVKATGGMATGRNYFTRPSAGGHVEQIHTQGHPLNKVQSSADGHRIHLYEDHGYFHYHFDNHLHPDHHDQSDHFEMDEDMAHEFREFRQSFHTLVPLKGADPPQESDEGNLSRSPSSVMLFDETAM
jgi:hypothetical protein